MQILQCRNNRGGNQRVRRFLNSFLFFPWLSWTKLLGGGPQRSSSKSFTGANSGFSICFPKEENLLDTGATTFATTSGKEPTNMSILSTREIIKTKQETLKESSYIRRDQTHNFRIHILRMISILWKSTKSNEEIAKKEMGEESSKPKPNFAPAAMERERDKHTHTFQRKLTLPSNHSTWSGMNGSWGHDQCYGAKLRNACCGVVIPEVSESSIITGIVPSHEREYYILEWDGKLAELNEWPTFRHKAYLLWCNLHPPIRCRCCCFSSPRLYVSVSLYAFSPSLAPLFRVSRILVSSIVQLWIRRELGFECHTFLLRWTAGIKQLQNWWMQQQGARRSWLSNRKGVVDFWAAESSSSSSTSIILLCTTIDSRHRLVQQQQQLHGNERRSKPYPGLGYCCNQVVFTTIAGETKRGE